MIVRWYYDLGPTTPYAGGTITSGFTTNANATNSLLNCVRPHGAYPASHSAFLVLVWFSRTLLCTSVIQRASPIVQNGVISLSVQRGALCCSAFRKHAPRSSHVLRLSSHPCFGMLLPCVLEYQSNHCHVTFSTGQGAKQSVSQSHPSHALLTWLQ